MTTSISLIQEKKQQFYQHETSIKPIASPDEYRGVAISSSLAIKFEFGQILKIKYESSGELAKLIINKKTIN